MLIIVVVLPLLSSFTYRTDVLCLNLLKNATFDHRGCSVKKLHIGQELKKIVYVADKYVRTAMFSSRIERFCTSELSGAGKNHEDTFRRHRKDTLIRTQKCLKTGKKEVMKDFFLPGH